MLNLILWSAVHDHHVHLSCISHLQTENELRKDDIECDMKSFIKPAFAKPRASCVRFIYCASRDECHAWGCNQIQILSLDVSSDEIKSTGCRHSWKWMIANDLFCCLLRRRSFGLPVIIMLILRLLAWKTFFFSKKVRILVVNCSMMVRKPNFRVTEIR